MGDGDLIVGAINFGNSKSGKVIEAINNMELDRCAGWEAYYKADYENETLRERIKELQKILDKLGIKSQKKIIKRMDSRRKK